MSKAKSRYHSLPPPPTVYDRMILATVSLLALASGVSGQCTGSDGPSCASWRANGFCTNTGYALEMRKLYCGVACGLCFTNGTQTALGGGTVVPACTDKNPNCAAWAATGFYTNSSNSEAMKKQYCCNTCSSVTATPTTACAAIYEGTMLNTNTGVAALLTPVTHANVAPHVFVKTGCSLKLMTDPTTEATGSPIVGSNSFANLTGTAPTAIGFTCTCA